MKVSVIAVSCNKGRFWSFNDASILYTTVTRALHEAPANVLSCTVSARGSQGASWLGVPSTQLFTDSDILTHSVVDQWPGIRITTTIITPPHLLQLFDWVSVRGPDRLPYGVAAIRRRCQAWRRAVPLLPGSALPASGALAKCG